MSIVAQCPHCETKFNLSADMAGKSMRCPNLDCRQVFTVKVSALPTEPPLPPPPEPPPAPARPKKPEKARSARSAKPAEPEVVEAKVVEAAVVKPPKVKEVVWSEGTDVPPPKGKKPSRAEREEEPDDTPIFRRRKKKNRRPWILIGLTATVFMLLLFSILYVLKFKSDTEVALDARATEEYKNANYKVAQESFEKLAKDYPDSQNVGKYQFFADLAGLQITVKNATNKENPEPVVNKLKDFIKTHKDSKYAKPGEGYAHDIHEAGKRLGEDVVSHVNSRVETYRSDRGKNTPELAKAEKSIATGRELLTLLEPFRGSDDPLDAIRGGLDKAEADIGRERARTEAFARAVAQLEKLSDEAIVAVESDLTAAGFISEPEAQTLLSNARGRLQEMVKYEPDEVPPRTPPTSAAATVLFVAPIGQTRRPLPSGVGDTVPPSVFLCVARGILYATDEESGSLLWAVRVGPDVTDPPAVARVNLDGGPTDLALVTSTLIQKTKKPDKEEEEDELVSALTGYVVKTGTPRWYQPLPAPAAGPAAVIGNRAYVAVRDSEGSIYEFDLTTGIRKGRIRLAQSIGPAPVIRPGSRLLYAAADARRVFVIDAGSRDDEGVPIPAKCVQVIATGHPSGTLRTPPVLIGPEGDTPGERWMLLTQADGPTASRLRAFQLQAPPPPSPDGKAPPETPAAAAAELAMPGWVWFPPVSDGERLALVTDAGQFRLFGVNQPGNFDRAIFPLPAPELPAPPAGTAVPGLILPAEEAAFWVLANGKMQKYRLALVPSRGLDVTPTGPALPIGIPTQPAQLNNRRDAVCLVVRSPNSAGSRAVLVNLLDGEIRWQRQLGVVPAAPPIPQEAGVVLVSEDGGVLTVPATGAATPGQTTVAAPTWVVADAPANATGPTVVAVSNDKKTIFTITPILATENQKQVAKWLVRKVSGGKVAHSGTANAPGSLNGPPAILGDSLLVSVSDGFVYRHVPGTGPANPDKFTIGPAWVGSGGTEAASPRPAGATCFITPTSDTSFLTNDGGRKLNRWDWPQGGQWAPTAGGWELRERPARPGLLLPAATPGEPPRLLIADVTGKVWLYPADRAAEPIRRWQPGAALPAGMPTSPFVVQTNAANRPIVTYTVENRFVVCLDPDQDAPRWAVKVGDDVAATFVGPPSPAGAGRWMVSDLGGRVTVIDEGGATVGTLAIGVPGAVPATAAGAVGGGFLAPLSDGSAVVLTLPGGPEPEPKKE